MSSLFCYVVAHLDTFTLLHTTPPAKLDLKREVSQLHSLLNIEQSIHQAVPSNLQTPTIDVSDDKVISKNKDDTSTRDELKDLEILTEEYEETMKKALELKEEVEEYDLGSGIK